MRTIILLLLSAGLNAQVLIGLSVGSNNAIFPQRSDSYYEGAKLTSSKSYTSYQVSASIKSAKEGFHVGFEVNYREKSSLLFIELNERAAPTWNGRFDLGYLGGILLPEYRTGHFFFNLGPYVNGCCKESFQGTYSYQYFNEAPRNAFFNAWNFGLASTIGVNYELGNWTAELGFRAYFDTPKGLRSDDLGFVFTLSRKVYRDENFKAKHPGLTKFIDSWR